MHGNITLRTLAKMIDHSLLHPTMTDEAIARGCKLAKKYDVATACVKPYSVAQARRILAGADVGVCAVIGFPHGNSLPAIKLAEARQTIADGADEIDMVTNVGKVLSGDWSYVSDEIQTINDVTRASGGSLKVIFETDYLQDEQIIRLCQICSQHQVAFVKTSTGYGFVKQTNGFYSYQGATDHNLALMRRHSDPNVQIKAAGRVRTLDDLLRVRSLGVTRIGATATETILEEARQRGYH
jgi:deoxyribose-phosphate aldolase